MIKFILALVVATSIGTVANAQTATINFTITQYASGTTYAYNQSTGRTTPQVDISTSGVASLTIAATTPHTLTLVPITGSKYTTIQVAIPGYAANSTTDVSSLITPNIPSLPPGPGVAQIIAGSGVTITPTNGLGSVTINSTGGSPYTPPTGTGFTHVTSGVQDSASVIPNLAGGDVTGVLPIAKGGTGTGTTPSLIAGSNVTVTGTWPNQTVASTATGISGLTTGTIPKATSSSTVGNSSLTDNGTVVSTPEPISALSFTSTDTVNNSQHDTTTGSGGSATCPSPAAGHDYYCYSAALGGDSISRNGAAYVLVIIKRVPNIQITTGTTAVSANTCTTNTAASMPGLLATDAIIPPTPTSITTGVAGWGSSGGLALAYSVAAATFNWSVCNQTGSSITPGGSVTWNVGASQ